MTGGTIPLMRAALVARYGPPEVVSLGQVPRPAPGPGEVLIAVRATTVSAGDWRIRSLDVPFGFRTPLRLMFGWSRPRQPVFGSEAAGVIEAVGPGVTRLAPGDRVVAYASTRMGAHADFMVMPAAGAVAALPDSLGFAEAVALPFGGTTALHFLRDKAGLRPGERLAITGAAGAVGSMAVQLGRHLGAEVTGIASAANHDLLRDLGCARAIDYRSAAFPDPGAQYDVILDTAGTVPVGAGLAALAPGGRLCQVAAGLGQALGGALRQIGSGRRVIFSTADADLATLEELVALAAAGTIRPVIDRRLPFAQIAEAHRLVESRRKRGAVVLDLSL